MALGTWSGLHTRNVPYGPRSIGCPLSNEEETYANGLQTMKVPYGPRFIGCPFKEEENYGPRTMGWPP